MTAAMKPRAATPENVAKLLSRRPKPAGPQPPELVRCAGCGGQMPAGGDCPRCSPPAETPEFVAAAEIEAEAPITVGAAQPTCPGCGNPKHANGRCYHCRPGGPPSKAEKAHQAVARGERPAPACRPEKPKAPAAAAAGLDPELAAISRALDAVLALAPAARAYVVARLIATPD